MSYLEQRRKHIENGRPLPDKKKYVIPKKSAKRIEKEKDQKVQIVKPVRKPGWFNEERIEVDDREGNLLEVVETGRPITNNGETGELWRWFEERRLEMKGICQHCGDNTEKHNNDKFHYSIAHLFAKAYFPSIATHPENWIELCYYKNSCHANLDNAMISLIDLNCFDEVVRKFAILYPLMTREEKRRIPNVLIQYLETEI